LDSYEFQPDVIVITESHLVPSISDDHINLQHYSDTIFRLDKNLDSGGVCVYFKDSVYCERLENFEADNLEVLWVKVSVKNWSCVLGTVYRNPVSLVEYWDSLFPGHLFQGTLFPFTPGFFVLK
jgi:hypothetical protein